MFGFGKKQQATQVSQSTLGQMTERAEELKRQSDRLQGENDTMASDLENFRSALYEKSADYKKAFDANANLQKLWKDFVVECENLSAEVRRLNVCVDERDSIISEHATRIGNLSETVRLAELNQEHLESEVRRLTALNNDGIEEIGRLSIRISNLEKTAVAANRARSQSEVRVRNLSESMKKTHLALMSVIDEMECPEESQDGLRNVAELPVVEEYLTQVGEDEYQATKGKLVEESIRAACRKVDEIGRTIRYSHNWTTISISPTDTLYEVEQRFKERSEIDGKIKTPFNDIPMQNATGMIGGN